ncbi:hypothetical protein SEMRO_1917_G305340.1 [Seminavis robusta]|uniref:Uncharacterized protein n=1 Tax=Seminavis robusta TaxID=568900 RepID=A0A9N8EVW6_9STRA|nr:hypothetical protein SEMRO_1917_G305340.1 [Seminavis robusta]|eukprot:Sro1917_g305340.1 n/a (299) ;mRNA; f:17876-18772
MKLRCASEAITISHFGEASVDFIADHVVNKIDYPAIRVDNPETTYHEEIPGYTWIKLSSGTPMKYIRIMVISVFECKDPPAVDGIPILIMKNPDLNLIGQTEETMKANTTSFHPDVVKRCHSTGEVVFTCAECLYDPTLFSKMMDKISQEQRIANKWDDLPVEKKRFGLYYWIGCNVFGFRERTPLPQCVVAYVRHHYPNEDEKKGYKGFVPKYTHQSIKAPLPVEEDKSKEQDDDSSEDSYSSPEYATHEEMLQVTRDALSLNQKDFDTQDSEINYDEPTREDFEQYAKEIANEEGN